LINIASDITIVVVFIKVNIFTPPPVIVTGKLLAVGFGELKALFSVSTAKARLINYFKAKYG
jgi:hypothetical protein